MALSNPPSTPKPEFARGLIVQVDEGPGLLPWLGVVAFVKPAGAHGWYVEVQNAETGMTYSVQADHVTPF